MNKKYCHAKLVHFICMEVKHLGYNSPIGMILIKQRFAIMEKGENIEV